MSDAKSEKNVFVKALTLEIGKVLGRYAKPPKMKDVHEPDEKNKLLAPFGPEPAWLPKIWHRIAGTDKYELVIPTSPYVVLDRSLSLVQERIRRATNKAIVKMWINRDLPLPELSGEGTGKRLPPKLGERTPSGTIAYRTLVQESPGGDIKQGEDVPFIGSDVLAATSRRIDKLCAFHWKKKIESIPCAQDRWPLYLRPTGWRFTRADGLNLAFTVDGTWWEIGLRVPKKKWRKRSADPYVMSTLKKIMAGDKDRSTKESPTNSAWIPSSLSLVRQKSGKSKKWFVKISYKHPPRAAFGAPNAMVVHCGLRVFAVAMDLEGSIAGSKAEWFYGHDLRSARQHFSQRRKAVQSARQLRAPGRGHKYQASKHDLSFKEKQWVDAWLRRVSSRIVRSAINKKAGTIFMMDLKNIRERAEHSDLPAHVKPHVHQAPWFRFKLFLTEKAAKHGIKVETYQPVYDTQSCPLCGTKSAASPRYNHRWRFACEKCGFERNIEQIAVQNTFIRLARDGRITLPPGHTYTELIANSEAAKQKDMARGRAFKEQQMLVSGDRKDKNERRVIMNRKGARRS